MIYIKIKELFQTAGLEEIRPTDAALESMGMSRKRFSQILEKTTKAPITVAELEAIKRWMEGLAALSNESLIEQKEDGNLLPV
jgi:hypothetical protein